MTDPATTYIYTLSLHDALPISPSSTSRPASPSARPATPIPASWPPSPTRRAASCTCPAPTSTTGRSEEHTSELQSQFHLVCRLLLEKKKTLNFNRSTSIISSLF